MKAGGSRTRPLVLAAVAVIVTSVVGFIASWVVSAFVLDKYDAYGEVAIPGSGRLHLPAGEVTVSFHTRIIGSTSGLGLPVPPLQLTITGPDGVAQPEVVEDIGATISVNNNARVRVWVMRVPADGDYAITSDGDVGGFIRPRLAFGHSASPGGWIWGFAAGFVVGVLGLVFALVRGTRSPRPARAERPAHAPTDTVASADPVGPYSPSGEGIRIEQLKTIASLRDCGALTKAEYEAEKRRILDGS